MLLKIDDDFTAALEAVLGGVTIHDSSGNKLHRVLSFDTKTREIEIALTAFCPDGSTITATKEEGNRIACVKTKLPGAYACFGGKRWQEKDLEADDFWQEDGFPRFPYPAHQKVLGER